MFVPSLRMVNVSNIEGSMAERTDCYEFIYSSGYKKPTDYDSSSEEIEEEVVGPSFITGDVIEVEYNGSSITYLNRKT